MAEDYGSAMARHHDNSAYLAEDGRWQEAAYLAGYAAECALKLLVQEGGRGLMLGKAFSHDLALLRDEGLSLACTLSPLLRRFDLDAVSLADWSERLRYEALGSPSDGRCQHIVQEAHKVASQVLVGLTLDGILLDAPR